MGASADTIWRVPIYLPYLQPALTDEAIAAAERKLGYELPDEYLELLRRQNGGYIRYSLPESVHDKIAGIGPHFPSLVDFDWEDDQEHVSFPLAGLVPFDGDGHWHLCLDYRDDPQRPAVTHVDVECDGQSRIADSFAAYLEMLQVEVEDELVLEGVADIEKVKGELSSLLGATFDPVDSWANGYPNHRARLGKKNDPQWLWISPNTVPRGFVRAADPRHSELKDLVPGNASRYPEVPADAFILSATDGVRARVIEACEKARLSMRSLRDYLA